MIFYKIARQFSDYIFISLTFLLLAIIFILLGITPSHDAIGWQGAHHFFYSSTESGVLPFWNPYSQTGTPFYVNYQTFGLLEPSNFLFIFIKKITGCTTLTAYLLHYFFYYYIFIIGTYATLRIITKSSKISLLFSMILLFACFPIFMRQNGALTPIFLIPIISFFLIKFFEEYNINKKGFYFFAFTTLCAIACLNHIPSAIIFFVLLFFVFAFIFKIINLRETLKFLTSKYGLLWIGASIIIMILISSPVFVLYHELNNNNEMFPSARAVLATQFNLVKCFVSDLGIGIFFEEHILKHSITSGNLLGLILEPFQRYINYIPRINKIISSEIVLYTSILPLLCIFFVIRKKKDKYMLLFLVLAGFTLLLMCNFKRYIYASPSLFQNVISFIVPTLTKSETLQNFGSLFLFCIVIISAVGLKKVLDGENKIIWILTLYILFFKYIIFVPFRILHKLRNHLVISSAGIFIIYILSLCFLGFLGKVIIDRLKRMKIETFRAIVIAILFIDLLFFNIYHVKIKGIVSSQYYNVFMRDSVSEPRLEKEFINYRVPFSYPKDYFSHFYGYEIINGKKVAFPNIMRRHLNKYINKDYYDYYNYGGFIDHFYNTQHYYDYLVNVELDKQLVTSSIINPILNFFPVKNVIFVENKYEAARQINQLNMEKLGKYIFIEKKGTKLSTPSLSLESFLNPGNHLKYGKRELMYFENNKGSQYPGNKNINYNIKHYDVNKLSVTIDTPEDGYFYYGDGYSKHWKAFLDDQEVKIEKTNINFKSVYVPKGNHSIVFIYDPVYFRYSVYASSIGSLTAIIFFIIFLCFKSMKVKPNISFENSNIA